MTQLLQRFSREAFRAALPICTILALSACATLPSSGPTGHEIQKQGFTTADGRKIDVVEVSSAAQLPPKPIEDPRRLATAGEPAPTDMVGPGDTLNIAVYEAGVALFGSGTPASAGNDATASFDGGVKAQRLPPMRVDDNGSIQFPYVGRVKVAGLTLREIEAKLRRGLQGMSQNPQVIVTLADSITNSIVIGGEVGRPGRLVLSTNRESLSDVIALAGGYRGDAKDLVVRVQRRDESVEYRLSRVFDDPLVDIRVSPADRITLIRALRTFSVLGAAGRIDEITFNRPAVSLAEAVAQAGGSNPNVGDPRAIFVFRYVKGEKNDDLPTIYHFDMMRTGSYFLSQQFAMRDHDVLYVGNARANQPSKLIQIISQLFSPIVTATSAVQVLKN
ncbi:MAG: capsule polysaccharide export outer membrane protein CtrA [Sphingomicrobium sp.]